MQVRDKLHKRTDYKGRPTDASDPLCPCRPCFNAHDCGYNQKVYTNGLWTGNKWIQRMECATRHNGGCPHPKPEPEHVYKSDRANVCQRCGHSRKNSR